MTLLNFYKTLKGQVERQNPYVVFEAARAEAVKEIIRCNKTNEIHASKGDTFYRTVEPDVEFIYITLKEPQRVYAQAAAIARRHKALTARDDDLTKLANNQLAMLRDTVGTKFKSAHQYMLIKAGNIDALTTAKMTLQTELNQSAMFIRKCVPLSDTDIAEQLATVFSTPEQKAVFTELKTAN